MACVVGSPGSSLLVLTWCFRFSWCSVVHSCRLHRWKDTREVLLSCVNNWGSSSLPPVCPHSLSITDSADPTLMSTPLHSEASLWPSGLGTKLKPISHLFILNRSKAQRRQRQSFFILWACPVWGTSSRLISVLPLLQIKIRNYNRLPTASLIAQIPLKRTVLSWSQRAKYL